MNDNTSDGIMSNLIPYIVHESAQARSERMTRRLILALVIAVVINALTVGCFLLYLNQYDFESYQQDPR